AEDEERRTERSELREREAVHDRRHGVLADPEVQVASARTVGLEVSRTLEGQRGLVRWPEIRGPSEQPGDARRECVQSLSRGFSSRDALWVSGEHRQIAIPAVRKLAPLHLLDLSRQCRELVAIRGKEIVPLATSLGASRTDAGGEVLVHTVRHDELRVRW